MNTFCEVKEVENSKESTIFSSVENAFNVMSMLFWPMFLMGGVIGESMLDNVKHLWEEFKN